MSELKKCPFCGNDDWYFEQGTEGETEIVCDRCEYRSQTFQTIEDAIKWWETRPIEDALNARIAELEEAQRWIPVSERLPEEDTDGNTLMAICRHSGEWVRAPFGAEFADEFVRHYTHWMYAPQPPEVQE